MFGPRPFLKSNGLGVYREDVNMHRREFVKSAFGAGVVLAAGPSLLRASGARAKLTVYKSPSCGCCAEWGYS